MKDSLLEIISLGSIILGLLLCFFLIFDYEPVDGFFTEEDSNAFLQGTILEKNVNENFTLLKINACKTFTAYSEKEINKSVNESTYIRGSIEDDFFIIEESY
jgi:hypothetical protein